ncbi:MAG: phosphoglucosamine mutase, partial [Bdellovibrionota bacterium]
LGGEQSGHIIFLEHSTTGDGIVAALNVLAVMLQKSKKLSQLSDLFETTPQVMKNVKVKSKPPLEEILSFQKELEFVEQELDKEGRVIVRYSGTEALVRVLVEGPSLDKIEAYADRLGDCLKKELS